MTDAADLGFAPSDPAFIADPYPVLAGLRDAGFEVPVPQGGYFALADASPLGVTDAVSFCLELPDRAGVVGVPASAFHDDPEAGRTLVRFAFCKKDEVLDEGVRRLRTLRATG